MRQHRSSIFGRYEFVHIDSYFEPSLIFRGDCACGIEKSQFLTINNAHPQHNVNV